ncbi:hypothetical protein BV22DRAFT_1076251 [Leucogyrophana mollusca]|uniref:Uncharacterized protein n=1 Tax=Leucogyrophana mollusca TaxID=85980 RepID=A0ACB8AYC4_9AGAM|nr:hypothetical protein BV22DRAFT_1076251 [Leucogyrophana mollusca]
MFTRTIAAFIALPFVAQLAAAETCTRTYTAQEGDICDSISAAQNVSTYQLAVVNNGIIDDECNNIAPGTSYCLGWQGEDCSTTYVVQANDDCDIISNAAGINNTILYLNNPQINTDCTNIYIGEVLCTASTVQVPPAPAGSPPGSSIPPSATAANSDGDDLPYCDENGNPPAASGTSSATSSAPSSSATGNSDSDNDDGDDDDDDDCDDEST